MASSGRNDTNSTFNNGNRYFSALCASTEHLRLFCRLFLHLGGFTDPFSTRYSASSVQIGKIAAVTSTHLVGPNNVAYTIPNSNNKYDINYVQVNGACQQLSTYQWGFLFLLLFVLVLFTAIWALGTYVLRGGCIPEFTGLSLFQRHGTLQTIMDYAATIKEGPRDGPRPKEWEISNSRRKYSTSRPQAIHGQLRTTGSDGPSAESVY
jgi:hypothetical protein